MRERGLTVITGATSGFGRAVARHLADQDGDLVLCGRDRARGRSLLDELEASRGTGARHLVLADLSSGAEVDGVVQQIDGLGRPVDLLVNNAGAVYGVRRRESVDGIELTMALNHFGPFRLTVGLFDRLVDGGGARVLNVASDAYTFAGGRFDFDDWQARRRYRPHRQYGMSKLANILFTAELDRRRRSHGVDTLAWSPAGLTATRFGYGANRLAPALMKLTHPFAAKTSDAVAPLLDLLDAHDWSEQCGRFVCGGELHQVEPCVPEDAERLWALSETTLEQQRAST